MINNCTFMGRITHDIELKTLMNNTSVIRFSLAVERSYSGSDGNRKTDFIPFVAFGKTAEFIQRWFNKGDMIAVTGELNSDQYEKNGEKRTSFSVRVDKASFCGGKNGTATAQATPTADVYEPIADDEENLPF